MKPTIRRSLARKNLRPRQISEMAYQKDVETRHLASRAAHNISAEVAATSTELVYEGGSGDTTVQIVDFDFTVEHGDSSVVIKWFGVLEWNQAASVNAAFYGMLDGAPVFDTGVEQNNVAYTVVTGTNDNATTTPFLAAVVEGLSVGAHNFSVYASQDTNPGGSSMAVVRAGHFVEVREDKMAV